MTAPLKKPNHSKRKGWSIKLQVTPDEEKRIKKEAIDYEMRVPEYILLKVLGSYTNKSKEKFRQKTD